MSKRGGAVIRRSGARSSGLALGWAVTLSVALCVSSPSRAQSAHSFSCLLAAAYEITPRQSVLMPPAEHIQWLWMRVEAPSAAHRSKVQVGGPGQPNPYATIDAQITGDVLAGSGLYGNNWLVIDARPATTVFAAQAFRMTATLTEGDHVMIQYLTCLPHEP